jgi:phosphate transport system substrate-binding protein
MESHGSRGKEDGMTKVLAWRAVGVALVLSLVAAACGGDDGGSTDGGSSEDLTGSIVISGSSTVEPISAFVAELFNETQPGVTISVDGPGTGDGFELFCNGETDISDASRPIAEDEVALCEENGVEYVALEVALDGITVMTNPQNAVACLNSGDLYALFGPESEGLDTWASTNDLAAQVGGNGGFPDLPLEITAPGEESGTYDAFIELSGIPDIGEAQGLSEDDAEALRKDYTASPNDNVIITAMEGSPSALGFVGFAFAEEAGEGVKELEVDGGGGCVAPSAETVADGSYPLSRSLFIYVNTGKAAESEALSAYVDYYLSADGLMTAVEEVGYVAIPEDRQQASGDAWASASA